MNPSLSRTNPDHARAIDPETFEALMARVNGPVRYVGREINAIHSSLADGTTRVCVGVADRYERAMSEPAMHALYHAYNRSPGAAAERAFLPDADFAALLEERDLALPSLESHGFVRTFDVLHLWVPNDLSACHVPRFLSLAGIAATPEARDASAPLVVISGPITDAPEPVAAFADLVLVGEVEDVVGALIEQLEALAATELDRQERTLTLAQALEGAYAPARYRGAPGPLATDAPGLTVPVGAARVSDLERTPVDPPIVAATQIAAERLTLEASRPAADGVRRARSVPTLVDAAERLFAGTGLEALEVTGAAIERADLARLLDELAARFRRLHLEIQVTGLDADAQLTHLPRFFDALDATRREYHLNLDDPRGSDAIVARAADAYRAGATQISATGVLRDPEAIGALITRIAGERSSGQRLEVVLDWPEPLHEPAVYRGGLDELTRQADAMRKAAGRNRVTFPAPGVALATAVMRRADRSIAPVLTMLADGDFRYATFPVAPDGDEVWARFAEAIEAAAPRATEAFPGARWLADDARNAWAHITTK